MSYLKDLKQLPSEFTSMPHQPYQQSVVRFLLSAGVVCVFTLFMNQNSASATCGDYLSHASQQNDFLTDSMNLSNQTPSPEKRPCSGPQCQNHRPDPSPASPVIIITSFKPACSLYSEMNARRTQNSGLMSPWEWIPSGDHRLRIERPPQNIGS